MKNKLILAVLAVTIILASCKKSTTTVTTNIPPAPSILALWKGKYGSGTAYPNSGYAFLFRSNGTVRTFNATDTTLSTTSKAEGTYLVSGTTVTTTYTYLAPASGTFSTSATIDANMTFIEGTWGSGTNVTNGGLYFIVKQ